MKILNLWRSSPFFLIASALTIVAGATSSHSETETEKLKISIDLPKKAPDQFSIDLPYQDNSLTLQLWSNQVSGQNTRFLIAKEGGVLEEVASPVQGAYLGIVKEQPSYSVAAIVTKDGLRATIIRPGELSITISPTWNSGERKQHWIGLEETPSEGSCLCGEHENHEPSHSAPSLETELRNTLSTSKKAIPRRTKSTTESATLPPTRVMDVLEYEVGVEIGSRAFVDNYGGNLASAQAAATSIATNMDARYLRGAGIKHVLGTVIIRTDTGTDPLRNSVTSNSTGSLEAFRNYWNANPAEVGTSHDLAVYHVRSAPSGRAWVNSVGSSNRYAVSCSNGPTSWADGTLVHEFGHSWNLRHNNDAPITEYEFESGAIPPSSFYESKPRSRGNQAGGNHTFVSVMNGSGDHNIGRLSTDEANTVYSAKQNKRSFGRVVSNPGQVPPFGHRDTASVTSAGSVTIDVIENDYDANNDALNVILEDSVSQLGGTISISAATGPGGRNELIYTPPSNPTGKVDFFHYTVCDPNGGADFGAVYVTINEEFLFTESFIYPAGNLDGQSNSGNLWSDQTGTGSTTVQTSDKLLTDSPSEIRSMGGKVTQTASNRFALALPSKATGGSNGTVRYISFIQKLSSADVGKSQMVEFWNGEPTSSNTAFSFGTDANGDAPDYGLLIDKDGAGIPLALGSPDTEAHLVVLKVEYGSGDADTISVFLDPGMNEPAVADASAAATNLAFNRIGFGSFQNGGQEIDEIRIGATYQSVVPREAPELFFEENFSYANGSLIGRSNDGNNWADVTGGGTTLVSSEKAVQTASHRVALTLKPSASGGGNNTTRFISFLQKFGTSNTDRTKIMEFFNGSLADNDTAFSFGIDTNGAAPDYGLLIDKNGGDIPLDLGTADTEEHLIVFKVEYGPDGSNSISVYVDPGNSEPAMPDGIAFYPNLAFDRLGIGSFQGGSQVIDEIRIGATFGDVVPFINPDSDADGLPDEFERTYYHPTNLAATDGTDDLDGDGATDAAEFIAGTDPTDPSSLLQISSIQVTTASEVLITWDSVPNINYSVWTSLDLTPGSWTQLIGSLTATTPSTQAAATRSNTKQFYQIRVNP